MTFCISIFSYHCRNFSVHKKLPEFRETNMAQKNIFGTELEICSTSPMTGFFRNGCCETDVTDFGRHTVCVVMTAEFLEFSKEMGNDLSTSRPEYNFRGLLPGDRWCLCLQRWIEAYDAGVAPQVIPESCHEEVLQNIPMNLLIQYAYREKEA